MKADEIVDFVEAQARICASGGGPKALTSHLAQTTGGGVLLEDAQWRHLAAAGSAPMPASARGVAESGQPGTVARIACGDAHVGWLSVFGANDAVDAPLLLRLTAAALAVELGRNGAATRGRKDDFWQSLAAGAFVDTAAAREAAAAYGVTLAPQYVCVELEAEASDAPSDRSELRAIAAAAFRSADGDAGYLERERSLVAFVPAAREVDASNARTAAGLLPRNAARRKSALKISGGVGRVAHAHDVPAGVATAHTALRIGRRLYGPGRVIAYDELGAYPLLYEGGDVTRLRALAGSVLAPLREYDEKHQTELLRTLELYFEFGQNVKTAAAALNVHRHTVLYRLRQIAEIAGRTLENPHDQLTLRMAVAIDGLHE